MGKIEMNAEDRTNPLPHEANLRLAGMIFQEMEAMAFRKERYDLEFPDHAKDLTRLQMWTVARGKVIHELCMPECLFDDITPDAARK
jgi:hypothetical protein